MKTKLLFISAFLLYTLAIVAQHSLPSVAKPNSFQNLSLEQGDSTHHESPASITEVKTGKNNILIYPNPSNGSFTVNMENKRPVLNLEVYNVVGERIVQQHESNQVNIPNAQTGIYFVKIDDGTGIYTKKITVQ
jgi:hypothetical protein